MQKPNTEADEGSLLVAFAERTSAHGVSRLAQGSLPHRLLWFLIIIGASCGFGMHLHQLVSKYTGLPVSTSFTDNEQVQFPWVTICPTDYITAGSRISAPLNGTLVDRPLNDIVTDLSRLYFRLVDSQNWTLQPPDVAPWHFEDAKLSLRRYFYKSTRTHRDTHDTVIYCEFKARECSFLNFTMYKDEKYFDCVRFNPSNRTMAQAGEEGGLFLLMYNNGSSYYNNREQVESPSAFKVALHEPGRKPDMSTALTIPMAHKTSIEFQAVTEETIDRQASPCLQGMPNSTYTVDYSRPGDFENVTFYGSVQDCLIRAQQQEFVRVCGCLGDHLAIPSDLMQQWPLCHDLPEEVVLRDIKVVNEPGSALHYVVVKDAVHDEQLKQFMSSRWNELNRTAVSVNCYLRVRRRLSDFGISSGRCQKLCRTVKFSAILNSNAWPPQRHTRDSVLNTMKFFIETAETLARKNGRRTGKTKSAGSRLVSLLNDELDKNYAVLKIYSRTAQATNSKEDPAYSLKDVFSDLGGILGLWVGVSVITLVELVELAIDLTRFHLLKAINSSRVRTAGMNDKDPDSTEASGKNSGREIEVQDI